MSHSSKSPLILLCAIVVLLFGCGGGGDATETASSGLKIFVTSRIHTGNFRDDQALAGSTAIAKADSFCQSDPARPSAAVYKALLCRTGINRDAVSRNDWVLRPSTAYYRPQNNVRIAVTTPSAVFPTGSAPLENVIHQSFGIGYPTDPTSTSNVWTGFGDASAFAASVENCQGWSTSDGTYAGTYGSDNLLRCHSLSRHRNGRLYVSVSHLLR